ncbi:hypothetical protein VMCG_08484 [Cytospora schulzeri]|uniref:Protein kinase domain-containing protein n=1 Tax=Cytospora schulzeri TaxID=448051 RepID=A0A423VWQ1_9PEZI|nr:hypothetical protein VMCG_08484 [Valsa malicola]
MTESTSAAIRYGHLFVDGEDQYLFAGYLARGSQCQVQLVVKVSPQRGELLIRKVTIHRLESPRSMSEDQEHMAALHIWEEAQRAQVQPNIVRLYSAKNIESSPRPTHHSRYVHRVTYMRYYNGGTLEQLFDNYKRRGQLIPRPLIRRFLWQVTYSLRFMYSLDHPVLYGDLEMRNIFVNFEENRNVPDFYVGDLGSAKIGPFAPGNVNPPGDIQSLHRTVVRLLNCPSTAGSLEAPADELERQLQDWLSDLHKLAFPEGPGSRGTALPDLTLLFNNITAIPAPDPRIRRAPSPLPLPLCHDTREAAINVSNVHGPWYLAKTRKEGTTGLPESVEVDESRTYHRPNRANIESDTDDGL